MLGGLVLALALALTLALASALALPSALASGVRRALNEEEAEDAEARVAVLVSTLLVELLLGGNEN